MHGLFACLCNSRIAIPKSAGHTANWPILLIWGAQATTAVSGVVFVITRRSRHFANQPDGQTLTVHSPVTPPPAGPPGTLAR